MPTSKSIVAEIVNKRTLNSKHYLLSDGSYQAVIQMGQIHFDDGDGNLHNINTDLFDEADLDTFEGPVNKHGKTAFENAKNLARDKKKSGTMNRDNFDYQGLQVPFESKIPRNFKRGYSIGKGADKLTFKPVNASPAKGYIDSDATNRIHYQDAWNDADVILELTDRGIKETITLKTDRAPSSFSFEVDGDIADDLTAGELKLQDAWLEDADGTRRDVVQTVRRENNKVYVDMTANVSGLVYPIVIDPTVTVNSSGSLGMDTFVVEGNPTSSWGTQTYAYIGGDGSQHYDFLSQIPITSIPIGSAITSATLSVYHTSSSVNVTNIKAYQISSNWDEGITWNTKPSCEATVLDTKSTVLGGDWIVFNIANAVQNWVDGQQNYGIYLTGGVANQRTLQTRESTSSGKPKLTVTYNTPPTAPTVASPNGGETWNSQETVEWESGYDTDNPTTTTVNGYSDSSRLPSVLYVQTFTTSDNNYLKYLSIFTSQPTANRSVDVSIYETDPLTHKPTNLIKAVTKNITNTGTWQQVDFNVFLNQNTKYALVVQPSGDYSDFYAGYSASPNANEYSFYGNDLNSLNDYSAYMGGAEFSLTCYYYTGTLQHQIQLSTDNGATWKEIVALTSTGATSYPYDFINETESSTCLIRVRAYDGTSYGPWDQSDGVFTIVHNQAPTAPTNLSPSGGTSKDRASVIRFIWQHNDPNSNDPQSKFDLQWRPKGTQTWNTVTQATPNQYYDIPANTLPHGDIEWQARTYDQAGLSGPYSALQTFLAGDKPASPTLTAPTDGATVAVANPTVQWSSSGQTGYTVSVKDATATEVYNATGTTNKAHTVQYDLANQTDYTIDVTITNADNLPSDPDSAAVTVSYTPPADPILSTEIDSDRGSITIHIDNPVPSGTEPNISYNDVYRRKQGETEFIRIATNLPNDGSYTDYTPASGQVYEYQLRVYGDNGTFNDSAIISELVSVKDAQLALTTDYSQVAYVILNNQSGGPQRDFKHSVDRSMMQFAGRESPVAEFGENDDWSAGLSFIVQTNADIEMLRTLAYSRQTLLYRDSRGRREFVTLDGLDESDMPFRSEWYSVSVNPLRVSFNEVI